MGGHVTTNRTTQLEFTQGDETWIVDPGISIAVDLDDAVFSSEANSTLINKGQISASGMGSAGVVFFGGGGHIKNSGEILSAASVAIAIFSSSGEATFVNNLKGGIIAGQGFQPTLVGDNGNETILNAGRIGDQGAAFSIDLTIDLGAGDDRFTDFKKIGSKVVSGTMLGLADLGEGNDTFLGGNKKEAVIDAGGGDTYKFGGGNDYYIAKNGGSDGNDIVSGGSGIDTFDVGGSVFNSVFINLDSKNHTAGMANLAANTARGDDISGTFKDTITGFENVGGGESNDIIFCNKAANEVFAGSGVDTVFGLGGNDRLFGGPGADFLVGGKGADQLDGQEEADIFAFLSLRDSTPAKAGRDVILDFNDDFDNINLDAIDANTSNGAGTNEDFNFLGVDVAFSKVRGGLRVVTKDFGWLIQGEVNGDKAADFAIKVLDVSHTISWSGADFDL